MSWIVEYLIKYLIEHDVINNLSEIRGIGHRVVFTEVKSLVILLLLMIVIKEIEAISDLAPLHNPHNLNAIRILERNCLMLFP